MIDREKVIRGLTCCDKFDCNSCPYYEEAGQPCGVYNDALELMKEQEPVKIVKQVEEHEWNVCGNCGNHMIHKWAYCPKCGRLVKWDATD